MLFKILFFIIGFILLTLGNFYIIIYINLFSFGYTIVEYLEYLLTRYECYYVVIGLLLIIISLNMKGDK